MGWDIAVIIGSISDLEYLADRSVMELMAAMEAAGIKTRVSAISAHRHLEDLKTHCDIMARGGTSVFIGLAGMSAALPGAIAACVGRRKLVFGVPLPSPGFEACQDSLPAVFRMPSGVPVLASVCLYNALLSAWQALVLKYPDKEDALGDFIRANTKPARDVSDKEIEDAGQPGKKP